MAFIRYKGPYAYLVHNERVGDGAQIKQRVLFYFGREVAITEAVIAEVTARFPDVEVDWGALDDVGSENVLADTQANDWLEWD